VKSFKIDLDSLLTVAAGVLDADGVLLEANAGFLRLLPATCAQPIGARIGRYFLQPRFAALAALADNEGSECYRGLLTIGDAAGTTRTLRCRAWRTDNRIRVLAEYDIVELERLHDEMRDLFQESSFAHDTLARSSVTLQQREVENVAASLTDALTGVGNRRKLDQALAVEIARFQRSGEVLCAIMTDVDHFKRVNDEYGHPVGDKVLARVGALLRSQTRPTDVVARFGGEEFIVLMPHTSLAQAATRAEQLRAGLAAEPIEPVAHLVTASFGVAELRADESGESFLGRLDAALYRAKAAGRNRVEAAPT
jgi:two-component system, cell cycle response regulator